MKASEVRDMRIDERQETLEHLRRKLFELRAQAVTEKIENSKAIRNVRRDIARILTIMGQSESKGE